MRAATQVAFPIDYKGTRIDDYFADLLIEDTLLIELKCVDRFAPEHVAQCLNYLRASGVPIRLLINFQKPKVEWKRLILS